MELRAFKKPLSVKISPKTMIMNIVVPEPVRKTSIGKNSSIVVKKPIGQKRMDAEKVKPKKRITPKVDMIKMIQSDRSVKKEILLEKDTALADFSPADFPADKKKKMIFLRKILFLYLIW